MRLTPTFPTLRRVAALLATSAAVVTSVTGCAGTLDTVRPVEPESTAEAELAWPAYVTEADRTFLAAAEARIDEVRKGELLLTVKDAQGFVAEDVAVRWEQVDREFAFGVDAPFDPVVWGQLVRAGVTQGVATLDWHSVQPEGGQWQTDLVHDARGLGVLPAMGVAMRGSAGLWMTDQGAPEWVAKTDTETLIDIARAHVRGLVDKLKGSIAVWEALREPNAEWSQATRENPELLGLLAKLSADAIRAVDPITPIAISYTNPLGEGQRLTPLAFTKRLADRGVDYDIIGLQFYYNGYTEGGAHVAPKHSLQAMSRAIDELATFGKDVHITGVSVPSSPSPADRTLAGFWGERWSPEVQATYLRAFYVMAMAQPNVKAVVWRDALDQESYQHEGGLFWEATRPKPAFDALRGIIRRMRTVGGGDLDSAGQLRFRGFGGTYRVVVTDLETGREHAVRLRVRERELGSAEIVLPEGWLAQN